MTILELAQQKGLNPKWKASTGGGEYFSPCPVCGGNDRFYIQPNKQMSKCVGFYSCRRCGISGDAIEFARQFCNLSFREAADTVNAVLPEKEMMDVVKSAYKPQGVVLEEPPVQWTIKATDYVEQAHRQLLKQKDILGYLALRGIPMEVVCRYKFGWSTENQFISRSEWGLGEQLSANGKFSLLWLPRGLVIPVNKPSGQIIRLKIRRHDWKEDDRLPRYVAVSGSMNGLSIIGEIKRNLMVVVESELDAYAVDHEAHDVVVTVAVGSNIKNPDNFTNRLAKAASTLLICHDNDDAGKKMLLKWQTLYPHAKAYPTPMGKDVGEAIKQGLDLRGWLLAGV